MDLSEGNAYVAETEADFDGFEILLVEDWKPGVKRVYMRKIYPNGSGSFDIVFADEKLTKGLRVWAEQASAFTRDDYDNLTQRFL
jgi:hypothetical protein